MTFSVCKNTYLLLAITLITRLGYAQNAVSVNLNGGQHTISKHIYGHFSEHLGRCIYDGFYVGENSKIPNIKGVRKDVVDALKKLKIPNLRWPGGCFADTYHWREGVGPKNQRPSMLNIWWGNTKEDNSFGTNEFLDMCELLECEPYLSGNVGSGTPQELADWVKLKQEKIQSKIDGLAKAKQTAAKARKEAESKVKEARAEAIRKKAEVVAAPAETPAEETSAEPQA